MTFYPYEEVIPMATNMSPNYRVNDWTFEHMSAWCERNVRSDELHDVREAMIRYLESGSIEDAEYSLSHGWQHIYDLVAV